MSHYTGAVLKELDRAFNQGTISGLTEGDLLERFVSGRDEAAFGALVARHGPMVLGVCRRLLRDESDVDDAFQATFLVLARRAGAIRRGDLVGHWLYGVAHRVSVRARAIASRRRVHEPTGLQTVEIHAEADPNSGENIELRAILDEELGRLPASLRSPVVLRYLEGLTHDEAARQLRWPVGTVRSRMARARDLLRRRLARRGFLAEQASLTTVLAQQSVPIELIDRAIRSSLAFATKEASATGLATSTSTFLAKGALHAMTISKFKTLGFAVLATGLAFGGVQTLARQYGGKGQARTPVPAAAAEPDDRRDALLRSVDRVDDLLDDLARRNADVQRELRALRKEILDLRSAATKKPDPIISQVGLGAVQRTATAPLLGPDGSATSTTSSTSVVRKRTDNERDAAPSVSESGSNIMVASPRGERVAVFNRGTGKSSSVQLPAPAGARHEISAVWSGNNDILALDVGGPKITRIAVYAIAVLDGQTESWYPQELREPVDTAEPIVGNACVAYVLGRRAYAFSSQTKGWDVVELNVPEGNIPTVTLSDDLQAFKVTSGSHIYTFSVSVGKWKDIDLNAVLDGKQPVEKDDFRAPAPGVQ